MKYFRDERNLYFAKKYRIFVFDNYRQILQSVMNSRTRRAQNHNLGAVLISAIQMAILQLLNVATLVLQAHMETMMKTCHHFCHQTLGVVDCLHSFTNLRLEITDRPQVWSENKLLQVAPHVEVQRGEVGWSGWPIDGSTATDPFPREVFVEPLSNWGSEVWWSAIL